MGIPTLIDAPWQEILKTIETTSNCWENFIGGQWVAPVRGEYFDNVSPVDGKVFTKIPRSSVEDVELALDAAFGDHIGHGRLLVGRR